MATMAARADRFDNGLFGRISTTLYASGSLSGRSGPNPFDNFGLATVTKLAPPQQPRDQGFTLAEARERIREFLEGTFNPKRLHDLIEYLTGKGLRLEARRSRDGSSAHYLVDIASEKGVSAASVDRRLSRQGVARMFGSTLEQEAEAVRQASRRTPEQIAAQKIRNANAGRLLLGDADARPFDGWDDIRFSASSVFGGREITVQGGEIYVGTEYGSASTDPAENIALIRKARAEGVKLIVPARTAAEANAGRLVPGLPILVKDGAVPTKLIDERLSYGGLARSFGATIYDYAEAMEKRFAADRAKRESSSPAQVVDFDAFRKKFAKPAAAVIAEPEQIVTETHIAKRAAAKFSVRQEVGLDGREVLTLVDLRSGDSEPFDPALAGVGRFPKEDAFGLPAGAIQVTADGGYSHFDAQGRFHNGTGPAVISPAGSGEKSRYAVDGEFLSRREFEEKTGVRAPVTQKPAASDDHDERAARFGR